MVGTQTVLVGGIQERDLHPDPEVYLPSWYLIQIVDAVNQSFTHLVIVSPTSPSVF